MSIYVIAEAASTHNGNLMLAKELVDRAAEAGADAVKFQYWSNPHKLATRRNAHDYEEIYRRYQMPMEWLPELAGSAKGRGLDFLCTTYLMEDIAVVEPFVRHFKIASFEAQDMAFLFAHIPYLTSMRHLIVSTGGMTELELLAMKRKCGVIADLLGSIVEDPRERTPRIHLLHCVATYPADSATVNLSVIGTYGLDGWSDHTACVVMGALAVAHRAQILEIHFRHEDTPTDHVDVPWSLTPSQLTEYIQYARLAEQASGHGIKTMLPTELTQYIVR